MSLSNETISNIAVAVKKDVISKIYENECYVEVMQKCISEALDETMGEMDDELYFNLCLCLYEQIGLN